MFPPAPLWLSMGLDITQQEHFLQFKFRKIHLFKIPHSAFSKVYLPDIVQPTHNTATYSSAAVTSSSMNIRKQAKRPLFPSELDNIYTSFNKTKLILFSHRLTALDVGFIVIIQTKTTPNRIKTSLKTINTAC